MFKLAPICTGHYSASYCGIEYAEYQYEITVREDKLTVVRILFGYCTFDCNDLRISYILLHGRGFILIFYQLKMGFLTQFNLPVFDIDCKPFGYLVLLNTTVSIVKTLIS